MDVDDNNGPPKKKLKQVQLLSFGLVAEKVQNKLKSNEESTMGNAQDDKLPRQDSTPTPAVSSSGSVNLLFTPNHSKPDSCINRPEFLPGASEKTINTPPTFETEGDISDESPRTGVSSSVLVTDRDEPNTPDTPTKENLLLTSIQKAVQLKRQQREEKNILELKNKKEDLMRLKLEEKKKKKLEEQEIRDRERNQKIEQKKKLEEAKEVEKKRKEEERRKKEHEKRRKEEMKEEDRKKKEEEKLAKERAKNSAKEVFSKFFISTKPKSSLKTSIGTDGLQQQTENIKFMPFPLKADMKLAVVVRHSLGREEKENLMKYLEPSANQSRLAKLYLETIKTGERKPVKTPVSGKQPDVMIVDTKAEENIFKVNGSYSRGKLMRNRWKLLQFRENHRPPYWGTWGKKSTKVTPRNPFVKDELFDYEVDSDLEWEDEEEGEDIDKEVDSEKEQSDDENIGVRDHGYVLDNTFVPHGYLSDEEVPEDDEEESSNKDQKWKMNLLKEESDQELIPKTHRLKPRVLGLIYVPNNVIDISENSLYRPFLKYRCVWDEEAGPLDPLAPVNPESLPTPSTAVSKFVPAVMEILVKLVHGNRASLQNLVTEFLSLIEKEKLPPLSKRSVLMKIKEIARKMFDTTGKMAWNVNAELCKEYNLPDIVQPIQLVPSTATSHSSTTVEASSNVKKTPLTKFLMKDSLQEPRKRVSPILVSSLVQKPSVTPGPISSASKPLPITPQPEPPIRKRIIPITLPKTVSFNSNSGVKNIFTTSATNFQATHEVP